MGSPLGTPIAIVLAAVILAASGLYLFRYAVYPDQNTIALVRLDRLTGTISSCDLHAGRYECR
jgi:hypothetical protein